MKDYPRWAEIANVVIGMAGYFLIVRFRSCRGCCVGLDGFYFNRGCKMHYRTKGEWI